MKIHKFGVSGFALAAFLGVLSSAANASCGGGLIEVKDGGAEQCVTADQFSALSDPVKATADLDDVAEAMNEDDDSAEESETDSDGPDSDGPDSDGPDSDSDGPDSDGPDSDGPDSDGPDSDGPDDD